MWMFGSRVSASKGVVTFMVYNMPLLNSNMSLLNSNMSLLNSNISLLNSNISLLNSNISLLKPNMSLLNFLQWHVRVQQWLVGLHLPDVRAVRWLVRHHLTNVALDIAFVAQHHPLGLIARAGRSRYQRLSSCARGFPIPQRPYRGIILMRKPYELWRTV